MDCVVAAQAAHWFPLDAFYAEVRRVARPQAIVCCLGYGRAHLEGSLDRMLGNFYETMFGRYFTRYRHYVHEAYVSLPFPFSEVDPIPFTMQVQWTLENMDGYVRSWSSVQRHLTKTSEDAATPFVHRLSQSWPTGHTRTVRFDGFMRLGRVVNG